MQRLRNPLLQAAPPAAAAPASAQGLGANPAPDPPGFCGMLRTAMPSGAALTCLQLLLLLSAVDSRPHKWHQDRFQLEAVKKEILERLGMSAPPVPSRQLDQESIQRAQRLYQQKVAELAGNRSREGEEEEEAVSGTRRLHRLTPTLLPWLDTPEGHQDPEGHRDSQGHREPRGPYRYHLLLSRTADFHRQLRVLQAELKLFKQPLSPPGASVPPRVTIYTLRGAEGTPQLLLSQELDRDSRSLELTGAIQPWLAGPEATLRLQLDFTADVSAALATSGGETLVLEVETQEKPARAARRARGLEEECGKSDGKCCLKSLKVSFQDIGWSDWVIAPNSYYMRFCEGSCPHNYKPASMHAQIKSRVHSLSKATPPPCCVPAGYDPMVLMHLDSEGRLVSSLFEDMLVTRCHCA
ncbi:PREDICTED: growth/differentiation factor 15 [Pseudopodoces humilis]|uniref:growth/differentiation factor 15 n=1 Tax=Pseudopodoces humilis TaxID=181119 RepID=UPI0006B7AA54|nr:PREDICTED: growth/differentiation factor 15 [Pseudopodoces humilis]